MTNYTLTVIDTTGIQNYIFGSNNLKQNSGASYLVDCATWRWMVDALPTPHNIRNSEDHDQPFGDQTIEADHLEAEVIYAGGGNAVILFANYTLAHEFTRKLTRRVLLEAPSLQILVIHQQFEWQTEALGGPSGIIKCAMQELAVRKAARSVSFAALGLGVTSTCVFTGMPAVDVDDNQRPLSAEAFAKVEKEAEASNYLTQQISFGAYKPARDFDDFGRTAGESSYIAVVHADGNGMGERIQRLRDDFPTPALNRKYIEKMRAFSLSLRKAARRALQETVNLLIASVRDGKIGDEIALHKDKTGEVLLPFRPIVSGGDDTTFVCDGRLGLKLAAFYLTQLSAQLLSDGKPAHCRAGIAIVNTHYPFARAYELAESLCKSAKQEIQTRNSTSGMSVMDWHFAINGLTLDLGQVRQREYKVDAGSLLLRPLLVSQSDADGRSWDKFQTVVKAFKEGEHWRERRNKVKALREALRKGPDAVKNFLVLYNDKRPLPNLASQTMQQDGWHQQHCGYFDAIEAMDFWTALKNDPVESEAKP